MQGNYYNEGDKPQFTNIDGTVQGQPYGSAKSASGWKSCGRSTGVVCAAIYVIFVTAIAIIAFILGCYSTNKVLQMSQPSAVLVSDPSNPPGPGYSVYSLGTGLGYWSPTTDMLHSRSDHGVISYGKYAYLIGGLSADATNTTGKNTTVGTVLASVVRYDTETGLMYEMDPLPEPRFRFAYAQLNGKIYVMGGYSGIDPNTTQGTGLANSVLVYDIAKDKWLPIGKLSTARSDACGAAADGKVYVFGGYDADSYSLATVEVCDPATATATAEPVCTKLNATANLNVDRGDCRAVSINNIIYAVGGVQWFNATAIDPKVNCTENWVWCYRFLNSVEAFSPSSGMWTLKAPMISARGDFGIESLPGGRIIVAGGERGNGTQNSMAMYDVEEYIVDDNIWVQKAPLPQARFRDDLAYVSGRVYAFGGNPSCDLMPDEPCTQVALNTVFAYFDVQYPRLYAFFKAASANSTN